MEEELSKNEQLKKQMQITLAKLQLSKDAADYLQEHKEQYTPEQMNEIRTALCDGVSLDEIEDYYTAEISPDQMKQMRKRYLIGEDISLLFQQVTAKVQRLQQLSDDMIAINKAMNSQQEEFLRSIQNEFQVAESKNAELLKSVLLQLKSVHGEQDRRRNAFLFSGKKTAKDEIRSLIEKGKYNPEQLQELTEAYSANLPEEQIQLIAKPENSAQTMKQLRLLYEARNHYNVPQNVQEKPQKKPQKDELEVQQDELDSYEDEELEDEYDESEEG